MNHVNDIAHKVCKMLLADPPVYSAEVVQGKPRTDTDWYPNRDGEWFIKLCMRDGRLFKLTFETGESWMSSSEF